MKDHLINDKILFFLPFLLTITFYISVFNNMFAINGGEYEFFFHEVVIMTVLVSIIQLIAYFILKRFVKDKRIIFIYLVILVFALRLNIVFKILYLLLFIMICFYKKDSSVISEILSAILSIAVVFLSVINIIPAIYNGISFTSRITHYNENKKLNIDNNKPSPNIYWFHMDGMPNTSFINKYFNESLDDFNNYLNENNYINNEDASYIGGHHTITSLNTLINPDYYDNYLKKYLDEYDKCELKKCKTKEIPTFKDLNYRRIDSELITGLKKKGYTTISIADYNQYTALKTDYVYDIYYDKDKCQVPYFKGKTNTKDIYNDVIKIHFNLILSYHELDFMENHKVDKYISCDKDNNYPYINKVNKLKETLIALKDAKEKDNNPKFYFIDNTLMHRYWNYDKEGNLIREGNTDLGDYEDCYIYTTKVLMEFLNYIKENDPKSVIVVQGDHGIHVLDENVLKGAFKIDDKEVLEIRNSTISLISIPEELKTSDEEYLDNPLNISRYLINSFVGDNYKYVKGQ